MATRPGRQVWITARTAEASTPGTSTRSTASASASPAAVSANSSDERMPRAGSGFTTTCAPGASTPARTTAITGSQPPSRRTLTARSSRRVPSSTRHALGAPIRVPDPAARTAPARRPTSEAYARRGETGDARCMQPSTFATPSDVAAALDRVGYLPDDGVATAAFLAIRMHRPLFLEGDPGVGKTALAKALAEITNAPLVRLQCYEGIDASQALYDWDFPRQVLHLRAAGDSADRAALEASLYDRRFLVARPILQALETSPSVLLIDEIDRADDEFEAFLLEVLADNAVSIPELGTIRAETPPLVVLTSNRTREVHDALKRRCLYHWVEHPSFEREVEIVRRHIPEVADQLAREVAAVVGRLREADLLKPPGIAETIDWTQALHILGSDRLDGERATATLGAAIKYHEDQTRV